MRLVAHDLLHVVFLFSLTFLSFILAAHRARRRSGVLLGRLTVLLLPIYMYFADAALSCLMVVCC
jgi:hypothetical protein